MSQHVWMKDSLMNMAAYADRHGMGEVHDQLCEVIEKLLIASVGASRGASPDLTNVIDLSERLQAIA